MIQFCELAGLNQSMSSHPAIKDVIRAAFMAGRAQGLDEARAAVLSKTTNPEDPTNCVWTSAYRIVGEDHAQAIAALKKGQP